LIVHRPELGGFAVGERQIRGDQLFLQQPNDFPQERETVGP
jgi:hypothetical protein